MITDIILENRILNRRTIIDTKFTNIFGRSEYRDTVLKSGYLFQLYAYLRSQEQEEDDLSLTADGFLLHPTIDEDVDEFVSIQGHKIRFVTVDLTKPTSEILARLRALPGVA